ncbi:MAG: aminotransferase class I/II-fold pyridoxal phosphate-dependent enzyme [Nevskiaceae bacterium]|nr:MAG: aminotransferase class I/II-fold pyridoxal phosphate-dependent enzyme [Burkholderiaceae bacterium]TBR72367.1 MAG: aminotransferase class I/II-fold pyridoxal phosphate-dependent enzyme [Nevskiaceae bacterium]
MQTKLPKVGTTIFTVMSQLALDHHAVNLGQGFPDYETPTALREALTRAMNAGFNQYAPMAGIQPLREQIALKVQRLYGRQIDVGTEITVTSGGTAAIFAAVACAVHADDEVIVLDPSYDAYEPAITLAGGRTVHVPLALPDFSVDWQRVAQAITPRTRMIIVNTPHNPSGAVFTAADLDALAELAERHDLLVIADEVYEHMVYDSAAHQSASRHPALAQRAFIISSFGKTWHCTGWKVGYCVAPAPLMAEFRKVHQFLTFCTFRPAQRAFAEVMKDHPEHAQGLATFYQAKRDAFRALLAGSRFRLLSVHGGFFQLADYSAISDDDDATFCQWLVRKAGVAAIPVSAFCEVPPDARLVRFCFAKSPATLQAGAEKLCKI